MLLTPSEREINKLVVKIARARAVEWEQILPTLPYTKGALFERELSAARSTNEETCKGAAHGSVATAKLAKLHPCASEGPATKIQVPNTEHNAIIMASPQTEAQPLSPDEESLYPLDSRCVSYILIQVKNLESYNNAHYQAQKKYRFCNPLGCGLESSTEMQDKRPYVALSLIFDHKRKHGPNIYKMDNTFIPRKSSEKKMLPQKVPQDHAFAKVLVNPQYAFSELANSLNSLLRASPSESKYLMEPINNFSKTIQKPLCSKGTAKEP